jgi:hypothetical protein
MTLFRSLLITATCMTAFHPLTQTCAAQTVIGAHETPARCIEEWSKPRPKKDDCYCGAYANKVDSKKLPDGTLQVSYRADPIVSGPGANFGCWYLTPFKTDAGYTLSRYEFTTETGFGSCSFSGSSRADFMKSENWQECELGADQSGVADLQFKFRIKGHVGQRLNVAGTWNQGPGLKLTQEEMKDRNYGGALITLYYTANK